MTAAGYEGADRISRKLGIGRCLLVRPLVEDPVAEAHKNVKLKDANDYLKLAKQSEDPKPILGLMKRMIESAGHVPHQQITTFAELRQGVYREFSDAKTIQGIQSRSFPTLNKILKGFRL